MSNPAKDTIEAAATVLVEYMRQFDPTYKLRIDGVMQEKNLTALKLCGRFFSYILRNSLQNECVDDLLFREDMPPTPEDTICEWCHKPLKPRWPGHRFHEEICTQQARAAGFLPPSLSERPPQKMPKKPEMQHAEMDD